MLETYSLVTAMPIDKCFIVEEEIELPSSPYITFHPCDTKGTARQYSYWKEVVDGLKNSPGFSHQIIQVGGEEYFIFGAHYNAFTSLSNKAFQPTPFL